MVDISIVIARAKPMAIQSRKARLLHGVYTERSECVRNDKRGILLAMTFFLIQFAFLPYLLSAMSVSEFQEKMFNTSVKVERLRFEYVQELRSDLSSEVKFSSGTVTLQKPRGLRLEQIVPESQTIVSSGKTVFIYTPRFRQVLKNSWDSWLSENILFPGLVAFSDALKKLKGEYEWQILENQQEAQHSRPLGQIEGEKTLCARLHRIKTPEDHYLILCVGESDFILRRAQWVAGTLSVTTTLSSLQMNPDLPPDFFRFHIPKNVDVIRLR